MDEREPSPGHRPRPASGDTGYLTQVTCVGNLTQVTCEGNLTQVTCVGWFSASVTMHSKSDSVCGFRLFSLQNSAEKVRKSRRQNFPTKVRKS